MDREPSIGEPVWLDPEQLIALLDELKELNYNIGVSQYIAVQDLVLALQAQGANLSQPERLKHLLAPLLCSSPEEQEDFQQRFDHWVQRLVFQADATDSLLEADERAQTLEQELKKVERRSRWGRWIILAVAACIAAILIHYLIQQWPNLFPSSPSPDPNPGIPDPTAAQPTPLWLRLTLVGSLVGLPIVTFLTWKLWQFWLARQYLRRRSTRQQPELQQVTISGVQEELFPTVLFMRISQGFRRRIRIPSQELDVRGTVINTLRKGGRFTPAYGFRKVLPEYLVLIDRSTYDDQQARFMTEMVNQLSRNGVFITGYYFDADPRLCFPMSGKGTPRKLRDVAAKHGQHRLLIFSDAEDFFGPMTGQLENWSETFLAWSERAVLTPKPAEHWGYQEVELSREFIVLPATANDLADLAHSIQAGELSL